MFEANIGVDNGGGRHRGGGFGGGHQQGGAVSGHELLDGQGHDSEGRPIEPQGQYIVTRAPGTGGGAHAQLGGGRNPGQRRPQQQERRPQPRPQQPRMVLVEVPENQVPPGAHVVGEANGSQGGRSGGGQFGGHGQFGDDTELGNYGGRGGHDDYDRYDDGPGFEADVRF